MFIEKLGLTQDDLKGKVAIVTGAGRGIGKELAKALAWLGVRVVIAEINESGKDVEREILSEGYFAKFIQTDVSSERDIENLERKVMKKYGKIDILVNNAITYAAGSISELSMRDWDHSYKVNIRGAIFLTKTILPYMLNQNEGVINFVTSAEGMPYMAPYFASKAALTSIGQSLAAELDDTGISVFIFGPGMVDTPGLNQAAKKLAPRFRMSEKEFLNKGGNPGYDGPMPADCCAAGWAYTIVNAKDYHGQIADPFGILLSKGLTEDKKQNELSKENISNLMRYIENSLDSIKDVKQVLEKIENEMEDLGFFVKKWMIRTIAKRLGVRFEKFNELISEMHKNLKKSKDFIENQEFEELLKLSTKFPWYVELVNRLEKYLDSCKEDAKGWFKNPEELDLALSELNNRKKMVTTFLTNLTLITNYV